MESLIARLTLAVGCLAAAMTAAAQQPLLPLGKWQSPLSATYTNPAYTSSQVYLDIDVANDGTFRGTWQQYFCLVQIGTLGVSVYSCSRTGTAERASGRFTANGRGTIELARLGRSEFTWSTPSAGELAVELPRNWQGDEGILYRTRMTRDGKARPATASTSAPGRDDGPLLSAPALYREFKQDERAALARHAGKTLVLEGKRGTLIEMSSGGAAIHIPDGFTARALVLMFPNLNDVRGIAEGAQFRFRCTVLNFDYQYVQMDNCFVVR